jgi:hypothetical protein
MKLRPSLAIVCLALPCVAIAAPLKKALFFDDDDVLYRSGTTRTLRPLTKHINPDAQGCNAGLLPYKGQGSEPKRQVFEGQIGFTSVYRHPDPLPPGQPRYQMRYQAYANKKSTDKRKRSMVAYAFSDDGFAWKRPGISPGTTGLGRFLSMTRAPSASQLPRPTSCLSELEDMEIGLKPACSSNQANPIPTGVTR